MTQQKRIESISERIRRLHIDIQVLNWPRLNLPQKSTGVISKYLRQKLYDNNKDKIHRTAIALDLFTQYKFRKMKADRHISSIIVNNTIKRIEFILFGSFYVCLDMELDDSRKYVDVSYTWFRKSPRLKFKKNILDIIEEELAEIEQSLA
jgi:hypothetical protein